MLTLRLKPSLEERLEALARRTGRTKTYYVARAIEERLGDYERNFESAPATLPKDREKVKEAILALKSLRQGVIKPQGMTVKEMKESGRA